MDSEIVSGILGAASTIAAVFLARYLDDQRKTIPSVHSQRDFVDSRIESRVREMNCSFWLYWLIIYTVITPALSAGAGTLFVALLAYEPDNPLYSNYTDKETFKLILEYSYTREGYLLLSFTGLFIGTTEGFLRWIFIRIYVSRYYWWIFGNAMIGCLLTPPSYRILLLYTVDGHQLSAALFNVFCFTPIIFILATIGFFLPSIVKGSQGSG
ncbi:MAG: hypothetical protein OHK0022_22140 [Roseiflexaceae bacterium]